MPSIHDVVRDMRAQASRQGDAERKFGDGLTVRYVGVAGERVLTLTRYGSGPTDAEILRWRAAFEVPLDAQTRTVSYGLEVRWPAPLVSQPPRPSTLQRSQT